jgi:tyrosyl-tRNA synthetase
MRKIITDPRRIDEILNRGTVVKIFPSKKEFRKKLLSGEKLRMYIGFDPTTPTLHLSHAKNFIFMEKLRKLGHEVIILFGDFTARIGDPTGENAARRQLSREEVITNFKKWREIVKLLMDFDDKSNPPKVMYNHEWLSKLSMEDLIKIASEFTVQQMIERDMFQKRLELGKPIYLHEFLYPLLQGYDSVAMDVDTEVCGTDQIFNALAGRVLVRRLKNKEKYVVALTLMENPKTGELMSKSKGIGVFLGTSASDLFAQVMAQPDEMIKTLMINNTFLSLDEIKKTMKLKNPRDAKNLLAYEIVRIHYDEKEADKAEVEFNKVFRQKQLPTKIPVKKVKKSECALDNLIVAVDIAKSKSNAWRLIKQGGVRINGIKTTEPKHKVVEGDVLDIGKKHYFIRISYK